MSYGNPVRMHERSHHRSLGQAFPSFVRCCGMNLAYTFPAVLIGGFTPLVLTWMTEKTGLLMFPAFYILFFSLLALPDAFYIFALKCQKVNAKMVARWV